MNIEISLSDSISTAEVIALYQANHWSSAEKPTQLMKALRNSHTLVTARIVRFYQRLGFKSAGRTVPMWIYEGTDH